MLIEFIRVCTTREVSRTSHELFIYVTIITLWFSWIQHNCAFKFMRTGCYSPLSKSRCKWKARTPIWKSPNHWEGTHPQQSGALRFTRRQDRDKDYLSKHWRELIVDWRGRKNATCYYQIHEGQHKQVNPSRVNFTLSREIFVLHNSVVPVGSGEYYSTFWKPFADFT